MLNDPMTDGIYSVAQDVSDNAKCMEPRHAITIALQIAKMSHDSLGIQNCFNWNALRTCLQLLVFLKVNMKWVSLYSYIHTSFHPLLKYELLYYHPLQSILSPLYDSEVNRSSELPLPIS